MVIRLPVLRTVGLLVTSMFLAGCASAPTSKMGVCQECYDAVMKAHAEHPSSGPGHNELIRSYECPCCKSEMSVYIEQGVHMVKCAGCAHDGVAWDECELSAHESQ